MRTLDDACQNVVRRVNGAVACGVVDLDSGFVIGLHDSPGWGAEVHEALASAALELFRGARVTEFERSIRQLRGEEHGPEHYFNEVQLTSRDNFHFAMVLRGGQAVLMLVTEKTTNVGMGWAQLRAAVTEVEELLA